MVEQIKSGLKGFVTAYQVMGDVWKPIHSFKNTILYSGYDVLAKCLAGDPDYAINGMYMQYYNGTPSLVTIPKDRVPAYYTALTAPDGVCRVKTVADPAYVASNSNYSGNKVSFTAITDGSTLAGATVQDGISNFFAIALVAIPTLSDQTKDKLFSAANIVDGVGTLAPILKVANSQVGFKWEIRMED